MQSVPRRSRLFVDLFSAFLSERFYDAFTQGVRLVRIGALEYRFQLLYLVFAQCIQLCTSPDLVREICLLGFFSSSLRPSSSSLRSSSFSSLFSSAAQRLLSAAQRAVGVFPLFSAPSAERIRLRVLSGSLTALSFLRFRPRVHPGTSTSPPDRCVSRGCSFCTCCPVLPRRTRVVYILCLLTRSGTCLRPSRRRAYIRDMRKAESRGHCSLYCI